MRTVVIIFTAALVSGFAQTGPTSDVPLLTPDSLPPGVTFPKRLDTPTQIHYPPVGIRCGMTGTATVELLVAADGSVGTAKIISSTGYTVLDAASLDFVSQFRYTPAEKDGVAIPARIDVSQSWKFQNARLDQHCTLPPSAFTNGTPPPGSPDELRD